jgi:hypothetical protein
MLSEKQRVRGKKRRNQLDINVNQRESHGCVRKRREDTREKLVDRNT